MATLCPGIDFDDIKWNVRPQVGDQGCFYVSNITGDWGPQTTHRVNGTIFSSGNGTDRATAANNKIDEGVYIYINGSYSYMHNANNVVPGTSKPYCYDKIESLSCNSPASIPTNTQIVPGSWLACRSGVTPTTISWSGTNVSSWPSNANGTFTSPTSATTYTGVDVTASCGFATCGNINVVAPSSLVFEGTGESASLQDGTTYSITCSSTSLPVWCMHGTNDIWSYSINGGNTISCGSSCNNTTVKVSPASCVNNTTIKITGSSSVKCKNRNQWYSD